MSCFLKVGDTKHSSRNIDSLKILVRIFYVKLVSVSNTENILVTIFYIKYHHKILTQNINNITIFYIKLV